jgi:sulfite reductase alpha subunit-like flavoprotein
MLNGESEQFIISCTNLSENHDFLNRTLNYQRTFQKHFLKNLKSHQSEAYFLHLLAQLDDNIYYLCAKYCTKNILDIILDFPDSINVIISLKKCLDKANLVKNSLFSFMKLEII